MCSSDLSQLPTYEYLQIRGPPRPRLSPVAPHPAWSGNEVWRAPVLPFVPPALHCPDSGQRWQERGSGSLVGTSPGSCHPLTCGKARSAPRSNRPSTARRVRITGPGPGRRTGLAARAHQLSLGSALHPRVVPETSSRASAGGPRRPSAHLVGPNRTLRSHFKRGRSFSEVSALTFPFHHHPRHTRYPVPVSRNAAT